MSNEKQIEFEGQGVYADESDDESLTQKYLSFLVNGQIYAFSALDVKEIIEFSGVTRIPMVPSYIRGVINLRGSVVPVVDLSARLGFGVASVSKRTCIVMIEIEDAESVVDVGVVIDSINEVFNLSEDEVEPSPSFGAAIRPEFIAGMGKQNGKFVTLLNREKVLSIEELSRLSEGLAFEAKNLPKAEVRNVDVQNKESGDARPNKD